MLLILFLFFIGLFFGSFFLVLADRLPRGESVLFGRSHCDHCRHVLSWKDLFPVISYLLLKGKCRYCKKKLSVYYPTVELFTGGLFALTYIMVTQQGFMIHDLGFTNIWFLLFYLFITGVLTVIFFADLKYGIIPFAALFPAIIITVLYFILNTEYEILVHLYAALGAAGFFLVLFLATRGRGMGFGDVVFAFFMGLLLGYPSVIVALYLAFLTGTAVSLILIIGRRKKFFGSSIPFGPFLIFGTYVSMFWGESIVSTALYILMR